MFEQENLNLVNYKSTNIANENPSSSEKNNLKAKKIGKSGKKLPVLRKLTLGIIIKVNI